MTINEQILECEGKLLNAIKNSNISDLEKLLHDDLVFNIPTGLTITKEMDLQNYISGIMKVDNIEASNYVIKRIENDVIVTVIINLKARYAGQKIEGSFKYLRIWKIIDNSWKIIAGSSIKID